MWTKITGLLQLMFENDHEWFWALDLDTMIMDGDFPVDELTDDGFDLVVNRDCNWFNAGSFLIRNNEWTRNFLMEGKFHLYRLGYLYDLLI